MARRLVALICAVGVAVAASVALLAAVHTSVTTTASLVSPSARAAASSNYEQHECLERAVRHALPEGARVFVGGGGYLHQLTLEVSALWVDPTASPSSARWDVSLVPGTQCGDDSLDVRPAR